MTNPWSKLRIWAGRWSVAAVSLAVSTSALAWPALARADEPTINEIKYNPSEKPPEGTGTRLFLTGAALTVGWYGATVGLSYAWKDAPNARDLRLPIVGPWMALGNVRCGSNEPNCKTGTLIARTALGVVGGVGQLGGLIVMLEGIFADTAPSKAAAPSASSLRSAPYDSKSSVALSLPVPVMLPNGAGIEWAGRF